MTLYDLMYPAVAGQIFHVYVTNIYDQNIEIGHGTRKEIVDENITAEGFDHLMDVVECYRISKDGSIVALLRDKHFEEPAENQYDTEYIKKWNPLDAKTRPWKHSLELEDRI